MIALIAKELQIFNHQCWNSKYYPGTGLAVGNIGSDMLCPEWSLLMFELYISIEESYVPLNRRAMCV